MKLNEPQANLGILNRMSRIFRSDGRTLVIAADHRQRGIQEGLKDFHSLTSGLAAALGEADAVVTTKEPMAHLISTHPDLTRKMGLLLSLNRTGLRGSAFEMDDRLVTSPQTALRWGLDGVKFLLRIDPTSRETASQLETCGRISDICERLGLPLILEPLYCSKGDGELHVETSPEKIRYAAIIANDFSVQALKMPYPKGPSRSARRKSFRKIVASVNSRVLILGGKKAPLGELLTRAEDSISEGGSGVVVGRNILLSDNPALATSSLRRVVHEEEDAETALREARKEAPG